MALVIEKILSGEFKGMHDFVDTAINEYAGFAFIDEEINRNVLNEWLNGVFSEFTNGWASERDYETEVILILSPIEVTIGEGK